MRLYRIPWRWDYHGQGAIIVMAKNKEDAINKAKAYYDDLEDGYRMKLNQPQWDEIVHHPGGVTEDGGCDC